jgi:periplasmic protein TonB
VSELVDTRPRLSETDRLGVTAFGSLLLHIVVILGVTFSLPKLKLGDLTHNLEITLVQSRSERAPDKAEFLAQANQDGGGDSEKPDIARNPLPLREISDSQRIPTARPTPQQATPAKRDQRALMTSPRADKQITVPLPDPQRKDPRPTLPELGLPAPDIHSERARLNAEISRQWQEYQQRPRRKFLNARTQEYRYALYMSTWHAKVERIGNLNYPEEAKRRGLRGSLLLDVVLSKDGTVKEVRVLRSSGHALLDDAARRIVALAAPFSPFSPDMQAETDLLHITRTWKFNDTLSTD